jgi:hypothetical protein
MQYLVMLQPLSQSSEVAFKEETHQRRGCDCSIRKH